MKRYCYLIAYFSERGVTEITCTLNFKIDTIASVEKAREIIKEKQGVKQVAIVNFIRLKGGAGA